MSFTEIEFVAMKRLMDHPLLELINARIEAAERSGAFDNLKGAGRPLPACDDPQNAVMTRILKENGAVPEEVALLLELATLRERLRDTHDRSARAALIRDIALADTRLEIAKRR
tara:strand:- start:50998 stop:51339 length:342 start_codon:yes stop_codon:yes gene_type:complete